MKFKPVRDRYFDNLADKFEQKIYQSEKGRIRLAIFLQDMQQQIPDFSTRSLNIMDAGGGAGHMALLLAEQGHSITLVEPAQEMLDKARAKVAESPNPLAINFIHSPIQSCAEQLPQQQFDVIVCHAVVEWLLEPEATLRQLLPFLKPNGYLSLAFFNAHSLILQNIFKGNFDKVLKNHLRGRHKSLTPINPQKPETVYQWLADWQMTILSKTGVRMFHDYIDKSVDKTPHLASLLQLEKQYSQQEPYINFARYIHVMAQKTVTENQG